ncbi:MAG: hypothetical protein HJJLKODD_01534 [Phycisphaerae bacterium]|nr:hypothetical protein [Phycisphaerae bacterium]
MSSISLTFERPEWLWLLLTLPLLVVVSWRALRSLDARLRFTALTARCLVLAVLIACAAGIEFEHTNRNLTVLFLLDRSNSIPKELYGAQEQFIREVVKTIPPEDRVGVLTFDAQSYVEQLPMRGNIFIEVLPEGLRPDRTDIAGAVRMAMALFPPDTAKRIIILSDGNNNVGDILGEVQRAKASGVGVDVVPMYYIRSKEIYAEKLVVPSLVKDGDLVPLRAILINPSNMPVKGTISLTHNSEAVPLPDELARQTLEPGQNLIALKVPVHGSKPHRFELVFRPDQESADTLPENNRATAFTFVGGGEKVLLLSLREEDDLALVRALQDEKIEVEVLNIADAEGLDLLGFMQYSSIILSNIGANWFTDEQQKQLITYVREMGGGLIMTGGDEAFGAGGWIGSPVEEIMPVDFEIKHRQVIPRGALAIVMHSCEMPRQNFSAKQIAAKAVETISSKDYFGLVSYSHMRGVIWDVPMQLATNKTMIKTAIDKMENGDMPDFGPSMEMAVTSLMQVKDAAQRHMIILSDGDASPPSQATINKMVQNKITCSTVGIGYGSHVMEPTLRQIATDTGGRFYAARNPKALPQIFVKESKVVRRPLLIEEPFMPQVYYGMSEVWTGFPLDAGLPPLNGMVLTSPKTDPLVEMPLVRKTSEGNDPVLAHWRVGLGKTVAFTSGYWSHWGGNWTQWSGYSKFWAQLVRWSMSEGKRGNYDVTTRLDGNVGRIIVNALDADSNYLNFLHLQAAVAQSDSGEIKQIKLTQVGPGQYEGQFDVNSTGQYVANISVVENGAASSVAHTGLAVPYSPEYKELAANDALLQEIVDTAEGKLWDVGDFQTAQIFRHDLPETRSRQPVWEWVLAWVLLPLFLIDVAVRRLASMVALSIFIEVLLFVVLLFGLGVVYRMGWSAVWGTLLVIAFCELVGWSIRFRSIRPALEFFTSSVVALRGAGHTSAGSLQQLKGTRERVRDERTGEGEVRLDPLEARKVKPLTPTENADSGVRFDVGDEAAQQQAGDLRSALGGAATDDTPTPKKFVRQPEQKPDEMGVESPMERLRRARQRARDQMDDQEGDKKQ